METILNVPDWQFQLSLNMLKQNRNLDDTIKWLFISKNNFRLVVEKEIFKIIPISKIKEEVIKVLLELRNVKIIKKLMRLERDILNNIVLLKLEQTKKLAQKSTIGDLRRNLFVASQIGKEVRQSYIDNIMNCNSNTMFFYNNTNTIRYMSIEEQIDLIKFTDSSFVFTDKVYYLYTKYNIPQIFYDHFTSHHKISLFIIFIFSLSGFGLGVIGFVLLFGVLPVLTVIKFFLL